MSTQARVGKTTSQSRTATARRGFRGLASEILSALLDDPEVNQPELLARKDAHAWLFESPSRTTRKKDSYELHPAFRDWQEWKVVVLSMLKARARLISRWNYPSEAKTVEEIAASALINIGMLKGDLDKAQWDQIFHLLKSGNRIPIDRALSLFRRIDNRRDNHKSERAQSYPRRGYHIISKWVSLDALADEFPGLCALDNDSLALFYRLAENGEKEPMTGPNLSRARKGLGLVKCGKATWKAVDSREGIILERR